VVHAEEDHARPADPERPTQIRSYRTNVGKTYNAGVALARWFMIVVERDTPSAISVKIRNSFAAK